ncbi:Transporter [Madurella fahalii]|uniref:Transporter n=1 Tax=Madurella fahalii TaxID=1157608 RepID=A0ABQ0GJR8_9PEZI
MSLAISQCVYSQIQRHSLRSQRQRAFGEQVAIFAVTRVFDVALATAAAVAAAAAAAHISSVPLSSDILQHAAVGGAVKAGAMAFAGIVMLAPQNTPFIVLPILLGTSIATNVLLVAAVANRVLGYAPTQLLVAAVVASLPLSFCLVYYYGAFRVPITLTSIAFDVLGAYTFVRMADNLGFPVCPTRPALVAGAVFGTIFSVAVTLLGCCVIGRSRTIPLYRSAGRGSTSGYASAGCCGNRVYVSSTTTEYLGGPGTSGSSTTHTAGNVYNSFHGIGVYWDPGVVNGGLAWSRSSSRDTTTSTGHSNYTTIVMR